MLQLSVTMMSWVWLWLDCLRLDSKVFILSAETKQKFILFSFSYASCSPFSENWVANNLNQVKLKLKLNSSLWQIIAAIHTCVSPETRHTFVTFGWINSLWTCANFIIWSHLMARSTWMGTFSFWLNFNNFFVVAGLLHHPTVIVVLKFKFCF